MNSIVGAPSTIPAVIQEYHKEVKADWDSLVNQIAFLSQQEDKCALSMGDILLKVKNGWGTAMVKEAAAESGITMSVARQRLWVSGKIPADHFLRTSHLTYSHLMVIAGTNDIDKWGKEALTHGWTVAQLKEAIEGEGDKVAQEAGEPCVHCGNGLRDDKKYVAFTIQGEKRHRACSYMCAANYFLKRYEQVESG